MCIYKQGKLSTAAQRGRRGGGQGVYHVPGATHRGTGHMVSKTFLTRFLFSNLKPSPESASIFNPKNSTVFCRSLRHWQSSNIRVPKLLENSVCLLLVVIFQKWFISQIRNLIFLTHLSARDITIQFWFKSAKLKYRLTSHVFRGFVVFSKTGQTLCLS